MRYMLIAMAWLFSPTVLAALPKNPDRALDGLVIWIIFFLLGAGYLAFIVSGFTKKK